MNTCRAESDFNTNERLNEAYSKLAADNRKIVEKNDIQIETKWNEKIWGVTFQINLGTDILQMLSDIQTDLNNIDPTAFFFPITGQHSSVNQVVNWNGTYPLGREKTWQKINTEDHFTKRFLKLNNQFEAFPITFARLIVTNGGVILCGFDPHDELQSLRSNLLHSLPFPAETKKLNTIIHTTVARFKSKLSNPEVLLGYADNFKASGTTLVDTLYLREELIFPSLRTNDIALIHLK